MDSQDFPGESIAGRKKTIGMEAALGHLMRAIKLSGREASVVRAIGFTEMVLGTQIQDVTRMDLEDITFTVNSLISAGFVETIPYYEEVQLAEMPATSFEINPAFARQLKDAIRR